MAALSYLEENGMKGWRTVLFDSSRPCIHRNMHIQSRVFIIK